MAVVRNWFQDQTSDDRQNKLILRQYNSAEAHRVLQDRRASLNAASAVRFVIEDTEAAWDTIEKRKFTAYNVRVTIEKPGAEREEYNVVKRYSFIHGMHDVWTKKFGKSKALPEIPKKKFLLVANIAPNFVNERRAELERYLNAVAADPALLASEEMVAFLHTTIVLCEPPPPTDNRSPSPLPARSTSPRPSGRAPSPLPERAPPGGAPQAPSPAAPKQLLVTDVASMSYRSLINPAASPYAEFVPSSTVIADRGASYSYLVDSKPSNAASAYSLFTEEQSVATPYASVPESDAAKAYASFDAAANPAVTAYAKPNDAPSPYAIMDAQAVPAKEAYAVFNNAPAAVAAPYTRKVSNYSAFEDVSLADDGKAAAANAVAPVPQHASAAPSQKPELPKPKFRAWNEEFQQLLEEKDTLADDNVEGVAEIAQRLQTLVHDFTSQAKTIANTIISEMFLPLEKKTIPPLDAGGIAGGVKFLVNDIFFKVSSDEHGLYGSYQYAQKAALLEFNGLMALLHVRIYSKIRGYHLPLMCILSSRGFTLTASSVLPLGKNTLIYGSADAASTVHTDEPEVNELVKRVLTKLNLKGHFAGLPPTKVFIHGPADIEVHRGLDGRVYILDTARLFPACTPDRTRPGAVHLYRLLRGEFVRSHHTPLSSDAFSRMATYNAKEDNAEVREATEQLMKKVIPALGARLWSKFGDDAHYASRFNREAAVRLTMICHQHGVNMRLLGHIYRLSPAAPEGSLPFYLRQFLLHEMVARSLKNLYFSAIRSKQTSDQQLIKQETAAFVNSFFVTGGASAEQWTALHTAIQGDFGWIASDGSAEAVRSQIAVGPLLDRWQGITGVKLSLPAEAEVAALFTNGGLTAEHVIDIDVRVKFMYIFGMWQGQALAKAAEKVEGDYAEQLQLKAAVQLRAALEVYPGEEQAYLAYGQVLQALARVAIAKDDQSAYAHLLSAALDQFENAAFQAPFNPMPHRLSAHVLCDLATASDLGRKVAVFSAAIESANKALELAKRDGASLEELYAASYIAGRVHSHKADAMLDLKATLEADAAWNKGVALINSAVALKPTSAAKALIELGHAYGMRAKNAATSATAKTSLFQQAFTSFERAVQHSGTPEEAANANFYWGMYIGIQSDLFYAQPEMALSLREQALKKYEEATRLRPLMWKAWWLWGTLFCRQAEYYNDVNRFAAGLAKVRKAREAFPSLAWGKQLEAEFLYNIAMRTSNPTQRSAHLKECLALLQQVREKGGTVHQEVVFVQLETRAKAELDRLSGVGVRAQPTAAPAPLPGTRPDGPVPTGPAQQTLLTQTMQQQAMQRQTGAQAATAQMQAQQAQMLQMLLMQQQQQMQGGAAAQPVDPNMLAMLLMAAQQQHLQAQQAQAQMPAQAYAPAPKQPTGMAPVPSAPTVMRLQPSGPFSTDVVTQMESADPATAFTALQQAFEFAQCQLNTRMPLLTAGVVDVMLQKNFFDSPSPDTRLLALSLLFNLCNVGEDALAMLRPKPLVQTLLRSIRTGAPMLLHKIKDQNGLVYSVALGLYGSLQRLCSDPNAAAASISSVESSQTGQMQLVDLIYKDALRLIEVKEVHVADLVLSLLWLLGANGYSAALMDAPLHMSLWIAHCTHHATDVRGFLCTPPVLKSPREYVRLLREIVVFMNRAGQQANAYVALYALLEVLAVPEVPDETIVHFFTEGVPIVLKGGLHPHSALVVPALRIITSLITRVGAPLKLRQQGADLILHNLSVELPPPHATTATALLQQLVEATQGAPETVQLAALRAVQRRRCTHTVTGGNQPIQQILHVCGSCALPQGAAICITCAKNCHKGHQLRAVFGPEATGTCDCGDFGKCMCAAP